MNKHLIVLIVSMILVIIGFVLGGVVNAIAHENKLEDNVNQTNSTKSDRQKIIVTWLDTNNTKTNDSPVINISSKDFWKIFEILLKPTDRNTGEK
jgi:uncharacterized membrane protein YgaE (UPF0421/DUF939 family)